MSEARTHEPETEQQRPARSRAAPLIALMLGACAIAFAPIFVRWSGAGPAATGFWRLFLALPALALIAWRSDKAGDRDVWSPSPLAALAGVLFALDLGFWHYGIKFTTIANATILANLSPVFVTAGAWLFLKERHGLGFLAGLALAVAGASVIAAARGASIGGEKGLGDALSIATAVWYAAYLLVVRRARLVHSAPQVMLWSSAIGAPLLLVAALALGERLWPTTPAGWMACAGLGLVHVAGQGAIAWALGRLRASVASVIVLAQPVFAAVLGSIIFSEVMGPWRILGAAMTLSGVALAQLAPHRARRSRPKP